MNGQVRQRGSVFRYLDHRLTPEGILSCRYGLDDEEFVEHLDLGPADTQDAAVLAAARLVFLLAGVSYYKAGAPPRIVVEGPGLTATESAFLREFYLHGLSEFAHVTGLDLSDLAIEAATRTPDPAPAASEPGRPLVPFGGGIDSIVVVEAIRRLYPHPTLFVANTSAVPFEPIERTRAVTGLPVRRVRRQLDPKILASRDRGYFNGHVPVTGVLSAIAVLTAARHGHDQVVLANEHSASEPTDLIANGVPVNHQWSKGLQFERGFRAVLAESLTGIEYYSALRPYSELWVARRFAALPEYHAEFRSCNRAFHIDSAARLDRWCGECDKCCFIDLILAPYLDRAQLARIFDGREPLDRPELAAGFRSLLGEPGRTKPLECVGDQGECRRAALLAAARPDRRDNRLLAELADYIEGSGMPVPEEDVLLRTQGEHFLPRELL